jgi:hypothetical protein
VYHLTRGFQPRHWKRGRCKVWGPGPGDPPGRQDFAITRIPTPGRWRALCSQSVNNKTIYIIAAALMLALTACGSPGSTSPSTVTVTSSQRSAVAEPTTTSAAPMQITIPEVSGQNAEIVRKKLEKMGLSDVSLSSSNPKYSVVVLASNWTCVSIEPAPGTVVKSDDPVVVKVYKD